VINTGTKLIGIRYLSSSYHNISINLIFDNYSLQEKAKTAVFLRTLIISIPILKFDRVAQIYI
jgi:hypothetical protein